MTDIFGERYEVIAPLGRGGMGVVFRARDRRLGREVALKLLHPWIAEDDEGLRRFRREAEALATLAHPNIVRLYDFDDSGERAFIVMELVDGHGLDERSGEFPLTIHDAASYLAPVASALTYAHEQGIVHRDLKPANVLVATRGHVFVSDFGLARLAQGAHSITATGALVGSPEYWAPEQASGREITPASDVYALGCVAFHMLTGHLPFEGDDRLALGYRRVHEDAPDPRDVNEFVDAGTAQFVSKLLARDPSERPTAAQVAARFGGTRLDPSEQATVVRARSSSYAPTYRTVPLPVPSQPQRSAMSRGSRIAVGLMGALALAALTVAVAVASQRGETRPTAETVSRTETRVVTRESPPETATVVVTTTTPKQPRVNPPPTSSLAPLMASYFSVDYPRGWTPEAVEVDKGSYYDTTIRRGSAMIRVDVSPGGGGDPATHAREVETYLIRQRGYRAVRFDRVIFNGRYDALWWEFVVDERGTQLRKVDIFFSDDSGNGFALLTQAPADSWTQYSGLFSRVRASLVPSQ